MFQDGSGGTRLLLSALGLPTLLPKKHGQTDRSRPGRTAREKPGHAAENESPRANTQHREIPGPYNSTPSRSRSPTRSPTCSRRPPKIPPPSRPRKEIDSTEARRPHNGSGDTFRPSRAHPFNPLNGFTHYWTLSSKFFSTFPRGTCSLSVSWRYLALEGVYLPLRAARSSNPTLGKGSDTRSRLVSLRAWHPLWVDRPVHGDLDDKYRTDAHDPPEHHIPLHPSTSARFGAGLFPVRSPLLRES